MFAKSLGYARIETTDLAKWREYGLEVLGMMAAPDAPDGVLHLKMDERPFRFLVFEGEADRLSALGWQLRDAEALESLCHGIEHTGLAFERGDKAECEARRVRGLVRFGDPSGNIAEAYFGGELDYAPFVSPTGVSRFETGELGRMGFGHAVLEAPELEATREFYRRWLGFDDSDYMHFRFSEDPNDPGQGLHFMHCDNPRHHSLGLYQTPKSPSSCVHLMVEVATVDEVGLCLDRVMKREIPIISTLGRHTNDRMLSFYMMTPAGFALEYGCQGLQMDWSGYTPTVTTLPSLWGHAFTPPEAPPTD